MIEQQNNKLTITFPTADSATTFATFLATLLQPSPAPAISVPLSEPSQPSNLEIQDSLEPELSRSRHTVLTPERQDQLASQREQGLTAHQRLLRAQTTLRDGALPFRKLSSTPSPTGQPSPRIRAQQEGGFADGQEDRQAA